MYIVGPSVFKRNALYDRSHSGILRATIIFNGKTYVLYENLFIITYLRRHNTELNIYHKYSYLDENMNIISGYWGAPFQIDKFRTLPGNVFTHAYTPTLHTYTCNVAIEFIKGTMVILREAY
jgi:hypothetical protein